MAAIVIPGIGFIQNLFDISHARILALVILLPAFIALTHQTNTPSFGRISSDIVLAAYIVLTVVLALLENGITGALRQTFYLFTDVFLPYFVASRSLKYLEAFRDAILSLVLAIMLLALIAVFETSWHWLLYRSLQGSLGLVSVSTNGGYLMREGMVRAIATAGQAIPLGYLMAVGIGLYLYVQRSIQQNLIRRLGMLLLAAGLIAPLSRGPWVGAAVLIIVFIATGRNPIPRLIGLMMSALLVVSFVSILPGGEKVVNLLPYIGSTEKENIVYREKLLTNSMIVIRRNPWFGSANYMDTPEMQEMRQGQGIIDIVNTYLVVALEKGLVGLGLFVGFFVLILKKIFNAMGSIEDKNSEEHLLGRVLLSTLVAIMVIIFTVLSITVIPIVYWSIAGMGVAYTQMVRNFNTKREKTL